MSTTAVVSNTNKLREKYWSAKLSGINPEAVLPVFYRKNLVNNFSQISVSLSEDASSIIRDVCNNSDQALAVYFLSGITAVLTKYSSKRDFLIRGTGPFGEVYYRIKPDSEQSLKYLINKVKEEYIESNKFGGIDFEEVYDKLNKRNGVNSDDVRKVDMAFTWGAEQAPTTLQDGCEIHATIFAGNGFFEITLTYNESVYERLIIEQFSNSLRYFFGISKQHLDTSVSGIFALSEQYQNMVLHGFNDTQNAYDRDVTLNVLFERQVNATPGHIALQFDDQFVSYKKLNELANAFAHQLLLQGIKEGELVAIFMNRSIEMIVAVLGILKAGGVYVPFEPHLPDARLMKMWQSLKLSKVVTDNTQHDRVMHLRQTQVTDVHCILPFASDRAYRHGNVQYLVLEDPGNAKENTQPRTTPDDTAYIIHTSGSSGMPKGVSVKHRPVINVVEWVNRTFSVGPQDKMLFVASIAFDLSVYDIFGLLSSGGSLYIVPNQWINEPTQLLNSIYREGITFWDSAPAALQQVTPFLDEYPTEARNAFRLVFMSGDWIPVKLPDAIREKFKHAKIISLGGATEATIWSNSYPIDKIARWWKSIPYGKPIQNAQYYILDDTLKPCPIGVPGDLYIGGECLASGYVNQLDLTQEKFVVNPYVSGQTMYKTGDLARWFTDGNIEFLGRKDSQVKIRGHRIELGEIEHHVNSVRFIKSSIATTKNNKAGDKILCVYYIADSKVTEKDMREVLMKELPEYMIPNHYIRVTNFPVTGNGKFDLQALPDPFEIEQSLKKPSTPTEKKLADIYAAILKIDIALIGTDSNFFELGGHSLRATQLVLKIQKTLGVKISLRQVFGAPVIQDLALLCDTASVCTAEEILPAPIQPYYPLSSAQKRFYLLQKINRNATAYNIPVFIKINKAVDPLHIEQIFQKLVERHESLRTSFVFNDGEIVQQIKDHVVFNLSVSASQEIGSPGFYQILNSFLQPFELFQAPLMRALLIPGRGNQNLLAVDVNHIISDGVSMEILVTEFMELFRGKVLPGPAIHYKDYAVWQNTVDFKQKLVEQERYWLSKLEGELPVISLPTDFPRPEVKSFVGSVVRFEIDELTTSRLRQYANENNGSLYMLLLAVFNVLVAKLSNENDLLIGTPIAGRKSESLQRVVGVFINTLLLRNDVSGHKEFDSFFKEVVHGAIEGFENQDVQFEDLIEKLAIERDLSRNPIFEIIYSYDEQGSDNETADFEIIKDEKIEQPVKFDLHLNLTTKNNILHGGFHYCSDLFTANTINRFVFYFRRIIDQILENKNKRIGDIEILSDQEIQTYLFDLNDTKANYPDTSIHTLFEEQVAKFPGKVALILNNEQLTYEQLNARANQLARILQKRGITSDSIVAIASERSFELVTGILAILKAGAAYLPIDPDSPDERVRFILEDSGARIFLTTKEIGAHFSFKGDLIFLEDAGNYQGDSTNLLVQSNSTNLAYIIYTSGTTGKPKGVLIEHDQVIRLLFNDRNVFDFTHEDVWTLFHSPSFDFSVWEIFGALLYGAALVVIPKIVSRDPAAYAAILRNKGVTIVNQTPSAFNNLLPYIFQNDERALAVRYVIFGGEALYPSKLLTWNEKYPNCRMINLYGITETTVHVTLKEITREEIIANRSNIGKPIPTIQVYIVDKNLSLVPWGVPGELCISGKGLSRGYLNRTELTHDRFVENPFVPGERMYKSGDLVRMLPNGEIEYLSRIDQQIKIRGHRIEPAEIKNQLLKHKGIRTCEVIAMNDAQGEKCLWAYYTAEQPVKARVLRDFLQQCLPPYMVPAYFIELEEFPLTANGKLKINELPKPAPEGLSEYVAPQNEIEKLLTEMWCRVLPMERVGVHDNFFEVGGNSLYLIKLAELVKAKFEVTDAVVALFKYPTIKSFAQFLSNAAGSTVSEVTAADEVRVTQGKGRLQAMQRMSS